MIKEIIRPNHCIRICDNCFDEKKVNYWNIKNKKIHLCRLCSNIQSADKKRGQYKSWNSGLTYSKPSGNYYINSSGYVSYYIGDKSYKGGYITEHRIEIERLLNRRLKPGEKIHHINGVKKDNKLSNLFLCSGNSEHRNIHNSLEKVAMFLVQKKLIRFDRINKEYKLEPNLWEQISKSLELLETPDEQDNQQRSLSEMDREERSTTIQKWSTLK